MAPILATQDRIGLPGKAPISILEPTFKALNPSLHQAAPMEIEPAPVVGSGTASEVIRGARELIKDANRATSEATQKHYRAAYRRMEKRGLLPEGMANTKCSFYFYRAAYVHHFVGLICSTLRETDEAQQRDDLKALLEAASRLQELCRKLEVYRPDPHRIHRNEGRAGRWAEEVQKRAPSGFRPVSHSQRARLKGLPADWREQMFSIGIHRKHATALAAMGLTGCRPAELERGVLVHANEKGNLVLRIPGAKTRGGQYGQEWRELEIEPESPDALHLANKLEACQEMRIQVRARVLSHWLRKLSQTVFPKLKEPISCYVYRHQMSADLKAALPGRVEISVALGHSSDNTQRHYASRQSGRPRNRIASVRGTQRVREVTAQRIQALRSRERKLDRAR
jgi:hypothetical protein